MPNLRPIEILIIVLVVLLLFGARRLPDLARSMGRSLKIFKSEVKDLRDDDRPAAAPAAIDHTGPDAVPEPRTDLRPDAVPVARPDERTGTPPHGDPTFGAQATDSADRKQV